MTNIDECQFNYLTERGVMLSNKSRPVKLPRKLKKKNKKLLGEMIRKELLRLKPGESFEIITPGKKIIISKS